MTPAIRLRGVTRRYPGVVALDDVSFDIAAGSCHAICGENGAGKSTLGKLLAGIDRPDAGDIEINGAPVRFGNPRDALAARIAMVHQELAFCENMSVAENLCLASIPARGMFVDAAAMHARARRLLAAVGSHIDSARMVGELGIADQQLVQIAAAVGSNARIIIFDEPTSSLGEREAGQLAALIRKLHGDGVTVVYVSHRMPEIFALCDTITVLRDGRHVSTDPAGTMDEGTLVQRMIGRRLEAFFPAHTTAPAGDVVFEVHSLSSPRRFSDVSFSVRAGEVLGLAGLVGAGRSEIANALFGLDREATGAIRVRGHTIRMASPPEAMRHGIGLVPEDRKRQGLVLSMLAHENTTLPILRRLARWGWIDRRADRATAQEYTGRLHLRDALLDAPAQALSGGNQQKVVLAKWLAAGCSILILDEPTRGVDVGAKAELHAWIDRMAANGAAVVLISSELPELINLATRVIVLRAGRIVGEMNRQDAEQDRLLRMMAGIA